MPSFQTITTSEDHSEDGAGQMLTLWLCYSCLSHAPNSCGAAPVSCHNSFFVHVVLWLLHCSQWSPVMNHKRFTSWIQMGLTANESSRLGSITNQLLEDEWTSVASCVFKSHEVHSVLFWFRKSNLTTFVFVGIKQSWRWTSGVEILEGKQGKKIVETLSLFFVILDRIKAL